MRPITGTDIIDFHDSRMDILVLTANGEFTHIDTSDVTPNPYNGGRISGYDFVTLTEDDTEVQVLLERTAITDGNWFPDVMDDDGNVTLTLSVADEMAEIINQDGILGPRVLKAIDAGKAWENAEKNATQLAAKRAAAVAEVAAYTGNQSEAGRLLSLDQSTVNKLVKKTQTSAPKERQMAFTSSSLTDEVTRATDASVGTYDVTAIVDEIIEQHGAVSIESLDTDEFWGIVTKYATD